ncbi:MAG: winged helix DNA-binding protein [Bacteroidota bacterium]|nr:winged helix DNA-binding protein [Bacteroidota bacterium]
MDERSAELHREFVDAFGSLYAAYGWKRLDGLIIGLLMARAETLSLDEICEALGRSKGPISESVRQLADKGLLRKMPGRENRRAYYAVDPELFHHNHLQNMMVVRKNRQIAEHFLASSAGVEGTEGMRSNLRSMHAFYTLMESFYSDFSARWQDERARQQAGEGAFATVKESSE